MNRRGFLGAILAAGVAPVFIKSNILMPVRSIFIPTAEEVAVVSGGNTLLTIDMITREALRILNEQSELWKTLNRQWDVGKKGDTLRIRMPQRYT